MLTCQWGSRPVPRRYEDVDWRVVYTIVTSHVSYSEGECRVDDACALLAFQEAVKAVYGRWVRP